LRVVRPSGAENPRKSGVVIDVYAAILENVSADTLLIMEPKGSA
jgi:hypothetical protein